MRLGWDDDLARAPFFAREFEQAGVAAVTIHGRTREQGFGGGVNLDGIRARRRGRRAHPDHRQRRRAHASPTRRRCCAVTGCAGIAIGRGALLNPWFFAQLVALGADRRTWPPATYLQRLDFMDRHFHLLVEHRGERFACLTFRKVANWYCRVLRPGRDIQQQLMCIESTAVFAALVEQIREILLSADGAIPRRRRHRHQGAGRANRALVREVERMNHRDTETQRKQSEQLTET